MPQVLVVEDNLVNQRISSLMLKKLGYAVDLANNGEEGLTMWAKGNYDAIIMDCQMPVLDGYSATARIRQQEHAEGRDSNHRMPIIALTAQAMPHDRQKCLDSGMDDYLTKPVASSDLSAALNRWLNRQSS